MSLSQVYTTQYNNKVLKNTYGLLALTTGFSALIAYFNSMWNISVNPLILLAVYFGLTFFTYKFKDSALGIVGAFAITGWLGFSLGPIIQSYLNIPNGSTIVTQAFLGTGLAFVGVNLYVQFAKPTLNMKWLPIMFWTMIVAVGISLVNYFFLQMPILSVMLSAVILIVSVMYLVYQTHSIINDGETNYILATVGIFASLYNIFVSLLNILGFMSDD